MLSRLRGNRHEAKPTAVNGAVDALRRSGDGGAGTLAVVGGVESSSGASKTLTIDEKAALLGDSLVEIADGITMPFSRQELVRIKHRFASMLLSDSLTAAPLAACAAIPELSTSPFVLLLLRLIVLPIATGVQECQSPRRSPRKRSRANEQVTFDQFLTTLSILSVKQSVAVKRQVIFKLYDADRDGCVSVDDLTTTLAAITSSLSRSELQTAALAQFQSWTTNSEAALNYNAFQQLFPDADVHAALTVAF